MNIEEALFQIKQNIKMHKIDGTTSNQNEREKALLEHITNLQEENERLENRNIYYINNEKKLLSDWHQEHNEAIEYKSRNEKAKSLTNRTIEIIKQQPSGNDEWILERLNGINYCLGGDEE